MKKLKYASALLLLGCLSFALFQNFSDDNDQASSSSSADIKSIVFSDGSEFPGASGSLNRVAPSNGDSIFALNYDFTNGGNYVAAVMKLSAPIAGDTVRFKLNVALQSLVYLRVTDETKQTLQFLVNHKSLSSDDTGWATVEVPVSSSSSFWGGALDGQLHGKITALSLEIGNTKKNPENLIGQGFFRQIQIFKSGGLKPTTPSVALSSVYFSEGAEFPGAAGSLEIIPPLAGDSIQAVQYDFTNGGNYVSSQMKLKTPVSGSYVRFAFRADSNVHIGVRVTDDSGQTLQKIISRNSLTVDDYGWATATINMNESNSHWGGANTGMLQGRIQSLALLIDHGSVKNVSGIAYFRQVEILKHAPSMYHSTVAAVTAVLSSARFTNGPEYPGAVGNMTITSDGTDSVHAIDYNLSKGNYVADILTFANPTPATEVRFMAKLPKGLDVALRVQDSAGQSFQTDFINRPLANIGDNDWRLYVVPLGSWAFHFNGPNDGVFRGSVTRVSVILDRGRDGVNSLLKIQPAGSFYLKNLTLGSNSSSRLDLKPDTIVYPSLGKVNSNPALKTGVAFHARVEASYAKAEEIGFKFARTDITWKGVESQKGTYATKGFLTAIDAMAKHDITPVFILDYSNPLYPAPADFPIDLAAFQKYAAALTTAAKGKNVIFEIWNEQDLWGFTPEQYAVLLKATTKTIQSIDPSRKVISGGLAGADYAYIYGFLAQQSASGVSALSIHPYTSTNPESIGNKRSAIVDMIASFGLNIPLASTEVGASSYWYDSKEPKSVAAESYQATTVTRQILTGWVSGEDMTLIYQLQDSAYDPASTTSPKEFFFGLTGPHMEDKASKKAVELLLKSTRIRAYQGVVTGSTNSIQAMKFTSAKQETLYVVWNNVRNSTATFTVSESCDKSIDIFGNKSSKSSSCIIDHQSQPLECLKNSNGTVTCTISELQGPVFVRMKK